MGLRRGHNLALRKNAKTKGPDCSGPLGKLVVEVQSVDDLGAVGQNDCQNAALVALGVPVAGGDLNSDLLTHIVLQHGILALAAGV